MGLDVGQVVTVRRNKGGRVRRKRRLVVEIDGQFFDVNSPQEAAMLLAQAVEVVEERKHRIKERPKIAVRTLSGRKSRSKVVEKAVEKAERKLIQIFDREPFDFTENIDIMADEEDAITVILLS